MKNNKGQALVEFLIILPVIIMIIFCVVDFGRIILTKNNLENMVSDASLLYENGKNLDEIKEVLLNEKKDEISIGLDANDDYITITINQEIKPITPGLSYIPKDIFNVSVSRVIKNE